MSDDVKKIKLEEAHKGGIIRPISEFVEYDSKKEIISISPSFDLELGGIKEGTWNNFASKPKVGKTSLALHVAKKAQELGRSTHYFDIEHRLKSTHLKQIHGLNIEDETFNVIQSNKKYLLEAEQQLSLIEQTIRDYEKCVIIIDSASALCSILEKTEGITSQYRNAGPKLLATFCRRNAAAVPINNHIIIIIHHLIANTSGYGKTSMEDGGNKVQFQSDLKLIGKKVEKMTDNTNKNIGHIVTWDVDWAALVSPNRSMSNVIRYGYGIDEVMELIKIAVDFAIITKAGSWYKFEDDKFQGEAKLYEAVMSSPDMQKEINKRIKEVL